MSRYVIIGASRGIGLELARQLAASGEDVTATTRGACEALAEAGCEVVEGIDVTSDESAEKLAGALADGGVDVLVCNAGLLISDTLESLNFDDALRQYMANALGPVRMTRALLPLMKEGGKIGVVTSRVGSLGDNTSGGNYGYRMSKAAANMAAVNLAVELRARGIAVAALHPGYVRTEMTGGHGNISPEAAARGLILRLDELSMETTGTFWHADGQRLPW